MMLSRRKDSKGDTIDKVPRIVDLEDTIKIIGMSVDTDARKIYRDATRLGKEFERFKQNNEIPNMREPWGFAAVSKDFDEESRSWKYIMGDIVTSTEVVPEGMISFDFQSSIKEKNKKRLMILHHKMKNPYTIDHLHHRIKFIKFSTSLGTILLFLEFFMRISRLK